MKTVSSLMNRSEEIVFQELENIAKDNFLKVFPKVRVSDVLEKTGDTLSNRDFQMFSRAHFDFVLTNLEFQPIIAIEYDGIQHMSGKQLERDLIKNELCRKASLGLLRINSKHVTRIYRGMTLLRWIVEVYQIQDSFSTAISEGKVPYDFDFDPLSLIGTGGQRKFPYWLSAPATHNIHKFFGSLDAGIPRGWFSLHGTDSDGRIYKLSYICFSDKVVSAFTSVRQQDVDLPYYTLLDEINGCELGTKLSMFQKGELSPSGVERFKSMFDSFCERFNASPSHSMGNHPFPVSWDGRKWK